MKTKLIYLLLLTAVLFTSCEKDPIIDDNILPKNETAKFYVLSEGSSGSNNSSLALFNLKHRTSKNTIFTAENGRGLGELANDMIQYGTKIYIVVSGSSNIEVINAATGKVEQKIPMYNGDIAKEPRYIASHNGKVYVSSYDDTVTRIDTTSLTIDGTVAVGEDPEQICVVGNNLYVVNSGGMNFDTGNYDNTVSVVNLTSFTETKKITVGLNPTKIKADENGNLYVVYNGNYKTDFGGFQKINIQTESVTTIPNVAASNFEIYDNKIYFYSYDNTIGVMDCSTNTITKSSFIADGTEFPEKNYIYSVNFDPSTNDMYITTTDYKSNGTLYCFNSSGNLKFKISNMGINPNKLIFM